LPSAPATTLVAASLDDTTSHGAGGLWEPYKCGATPAGLIARWGGATLDHLRRLARSPDAGRAGVAEHAVFQLWSAAGPAPQPPDPAWASLVAPTFRRLDRSELGAWEAAATHTPGGTVQYSSGWTFTSVTAQPGRYLPWLAARARAAGVEAVVASVASLADLAALSPARPAALVNCAGLGARALCGDASLGPVRGQVARLAAPWVKAAVFVDEDTVREREQHCPRDAVPGRRETGRGRAFSCVSLSLSQPSSPLSLSPSNTHTQYVIPNTDFTVVGGTAQVGDYDTAPRADDRADILTRAARAVPGLVGAPSLGDWAGLRPVRTTMRVELEEAGGGGGVPGIPVVHNYGHGGSGVTLHWGCAADAAALGEGGLRRKGGV